MNILRLGALALITGIGLLLVRRLRRWAGDPPAQRASHKEAIEPPELVARYSRFMSILPMQVARGIMGRYAVSGAMPWRILDVGCGPGWFPLELADLAGEATVIGVDLSYPMMQTAVAHAAAVGKERVAFAQARGEVLPFADGTFDLVVSTLALHHLQDPVTALEELQRVAGPAGRIVVFDLRRDISPWLWTIFKVAQAPIDSLNLCENGEPSSSIAASYTPGEAQRLALQAGWKRTRVRGFPGWIVLERPAGQAGPFTVPTAPRGEREIAP